MKNLNKLSSTEQKKEASDVVYENLMDYFFNQIVFINLAFSDLGDVDNNPATPNGTTSTTDYGKSSRIIDTARGRLMAPGRSSRIRCQFYLRSPNVIDGYILSPAVFDSQNLPGSLTTMSVFRSYVGLKFRNGETFVAVKEAGKTEVLYPITFELTMSDATFTDTFSLEIIHNVRSTDIIINGVSHGSYASDLVGTTSSVEVFYPFFAPARSTSGTLVNIVCENIQFMQNRED